MTPVDRQWLEDLVTTIGKRPKKVLEVLLEKGEVSTYELGKLGYDQPPRAAQDLKEAGVKLNTRNDKHPVTGNRMVIYSLADDQKSSLSSGGRIAFPKVFREKLVKRANYKCIICNTEYSPRLLQIDHKIPFIVGGEPKEIIIEEFQLLCASHQRMKSWECEHCPNLIEKVKDICTNCYWASPEDYKHVATMQHKIITLKLDTKEEIAMLDSAKGYAEEHGISLEEYIKQLISKSLDS